VHACIYNKNRLYVHIFIGVSAHTFMNICVSKTNSHYEKNGRGEPSFHGACGVHTLIGGHH
jgi:hypothetical protein